VGILSLTLVAGMISPAMAQTLAVDGPIIAAVEHGKQTSSSASQYVWQYGVDAAPFTQDATITYKNVDNVVTQDPWIINGLSTSLNGDTKDAASDAGFSILSASNTSGDTTCVVGSPAVLPCTLGYDDTIVFSVQALTFTEIGTDTVFFNLRLMDTCDGTPDEDGDCTEAEELTIETEMRQSYLNYVSSEIKIHDWRGNSSLNIERRLPATF